MTAHVGAAGTHKTVDQMHVGVSSAWKIVQSGYVGVSGAWKEFFTNFAIEASASSLTKLSASTGTVFTGSVTVTATGSGPFTIAWSNGGPDAQIFPNSPTSFTTTFGASLSTGDAFSATMAGTVTDTSTGDQLVVFVSVAIEHVS